jgi:hypothetical protein
LRFFSGGVEGDLPVVLSALRCYVCQGENRYKAAFFAPRDSPETKSSRIPQD